MGLGVGGSYIWCLIIIVLFMRLGGTKKWEGGEVLKSSKRGKALKGGPNYMWGVNPSRNFVFINYTLL